jgi:asparagine synthase (glutamine-hydrolysing)
MCGIAGIIGQANPSNRSALERMSAAMAHRGPDGEGIWETPRDEGDWCVMLAHRRLSILDLSPAGAQPMIDPATGHVIVLNGEIYNYVALRQELEGAGEEVESSGDTAVLLRVLGLRGESAIPALRGMFAFAWWNPASRKLVLARDPLGIKPLYLARNPDPRGSWSIAFASELRAIMASGLLGTPRVNPAAVASVVWNGFVVAPETMVSGVEAVLPGQLRVFDSRGIEERSRLYWSARAPHGGVPPSDAELTRSLTESVRVHLASDVPLCVFLSGGVDSSAVANMAKTASGTPVHTFTLAFEEEAFNEGIAARAISDAIGTIHHEVVLTEGQFISQLEPALSSLDQPTFDGLNSYYMSQAVRGAGFTVALVGTGGDELFGGYKSFRDLPRLLRWSRRTSWVPESLRAALATAVASAMQPRRGPFPPQTRWAKLPEMFRPGRSLLALYQMAYALFLPDFQRDLLGKEASAALVDGLPDAMHGRLELEADSRSPVSAISVMELRMFLGERLLRDTDAASMAASIEVRLPLVDHLVFESVDRMSDTSRFEPLGHKSTLRRIGLHGLDPGLFDRPKSGFVLPYDRWIRTSLGKVMNRTMSDSDAVRSTGLDPQVVRQLWRAFLEGAPGLYWSRIWALYVLVRWCHQNGVTI